MAVLHILYVQDFSAKPGNGPVADGDAPTIRLSAWLEARDWSRATGYNLRKRGWLKWKPIAGVPYLSPNAIAEFNRRWNQGEFAKPPVSETELRRQKKRAKSNVVQLELDL